MKKTFLLVAICFVFGGGGVFFLKAVESDSVQPSNLGFETGTLHDWVATRQVRDSTGVLRALVKSDRVLFRGTRPPEPEHGRTGLPAAAR